MLASLAQFLLFQLAGELIARIFHWPIPGPVIGMALLLLFLLARGHASPQLKQGAGSLLQYLSLLFVPAGVGVIQHLQRLGQEWLPITIALIVSTFAGIAVTAVVLHVLIRKRLSKEGGAS